MKRHTADEDKTNTRKKTQEKHKSIKTQTSHKTDNCTFPCSVGVLLFREKDNIATIYRVS